MSGNKVLIAGLIGAGILALGAIGIVVIAQMLAGGGTPVSSDAEEIKLDASEFQDLLRTGIDISDGEYDTFYDIEDAESGDVLKISGVIERADDYGREVRLVIVDAAEYDANETGFGSGLNLQVQNARDGEFERGDRVEITLNVVSFNCKADESYFDFDPLFDPIDDLLTGRDHMITGEYIDEFIHHRGQTCSLSERLDNTDPIENLGPVG